jgi:predicted O-methyltransferase YrrM
MDRKLVWFLAKKPAAWGSCIKVAGAMLMKRSEVTVNREGIRLTVRIGNGRGLFCALAGTDYEAEMRWFLAKMNEGDLFVDVGANIGVYTLHASRRVGVEGKIISFEPTPETFSDLQQNVQSNR